MALTLRASSPAFFTFLSHRRVTSSCVVPHFSALSDIYLLCHLKSYDGNSQLFRDFFHISNHLSVVYEQFFSSSSVWLRVSLESVLHFETKFVFKSSEMSLLPRFRMILWSHGRSIYAEHVAMFQFAYRRDENVNCQQTEKKGHSRQSFGCMNSISETGNFFTC